MPLDPFLELSLQHSKDLHESVKNLGKLMGADDSQPIRPVRLADLLTADHIRAYARHMAEKFDLVYVTDETVGLKETLKAAILKMRPDTNVEEYLQSWAFTLGNLVWLPFSLEHPASKPKWPFYWQVVTIAHEATHRIQFREYGASAFSWDYLTNEESRGQYEYEAYRGALELVPVLTGETYDPADLAAPLAAYGLGPSAIAFVVQQLTLAQAIILRGGTLSETSRAALVWLADHVHRS